jgi:phosphoglycolate phosphatase-like HAD superfamily hydrolase
MTALQWTASDEHPLGFPRALILSSREGDMQPSTPVVRLLITDLDNTLFDWLGVWHAAFSAMLARLSADSGVPEDVLVDEFREVHQEHGTVEYAFSIEELPSLRRRTPAADLLDKYAGAIQAFREARREQLHLYPGVESTLRFLRKTGCGIAAYTESLAFYSAYRIRRLDLDLLLDLVYSPADHDLPPGRSRESLRRYPADHYELRGTQHHHTPSGERKPNPDILLSIVRELGADPESTLYVGDSLVKDVMMAHDAGVIDAWAAYGYSPDRREYELLRRVTHWSKEDVEREITLSRRAVRPTYVLERSFSELLDLFDFRPLAGDALVAPESESADTRN